MHNLFQTMSTHYEISRTWILRLGLKFEAQKTAKTDRSGLKFDTQTEGLGKITVSYNVFNGLK